MAVRPLPPAECLANRYDAIIDARSPAEFALDHLPGALNWPTLDDAQRHDIGTRYKQVSAFEARKAGAALVARNIAMHIEAHVMPLPREWRPLVYCWRGGQRSGSLALVLGQIGFQVDVIQGGYKAWRALVREQLEALPTPLRFRVLCGRTGSAKTKLLLALRAAGAQVLDLEGLARHRGSVLGGEPGEPQPSQKHFESCIWHSLRSLDASRPVYVESESRRIGALRVPEGLIHRMRTAGECLRVEMSDEARVAHLMQAYAHFVRDPEPLCTALQALTTLRGHEQVQAWQAMARGGQWPALLHSLLHDHYDPLYERSLASSYGSLAQAPVVALADAQDAELAAHAQRLVAQDAALA